MAVLVAGTAASCFSQEEDPVDAGTSKRDSGTVIEPDGGSNPDGGGSNSCDQDSSLTANSITATKAATDTNVRGKYVEIKDAVVVAGRVYNNAGTFWVQDQSGGPGVAVYKSYKDDTLFPAIGDVVTVKGRLTTHSGSLQVSTNCGKGMLLSVTKTGTGTAKSGAMPPAGSPTLISADEFSGYAHTELEAYPEQVGTVVQFEGPLEVTDARPAGLVETSTADGGTKTQGRGFEITGGIWVSDDAIYAACLKSLDGGTPNLQNGIRGVWEKYQDFYGEKVTYPVLKPLSCDDLNPSND